MICKIFLKASFSSGAPAFIACLFVNESEVVGEPELRPGSDRKAKVRLLRAKVASIARPKLTLNIRPVSCFRTQSTLFARCYSAQGLQTSGVSERCSFVSCKLEAWTNKFACIKF